MADKPDEKDEPQDVSGFLGTDPIYMNYSDDRNKPFRAEEDDEHEGPQDNAEVVATEDVAYSHQEWTREDAGQDPATGEPLDISEQDAFDAKRDQYKDPNWGPNVPHAMTGKPDEVSDNSGDVLSNETDEEFAARVAKANEHNAASADTGSTGEVEADGTTEKTASTPSAPSAPAAKKAAATDKK